MVYRTLIGLVIGGAMACSQLWAGEGFGPELQNETFSLLHRGDRAALAFELLAAAYRPEDSMAALKKTVDGMPEEKRLAIPEYLVLKQYKLILAGDLEGILSDYRTDKDKGFAREQFADLASVQRYCRERTRGIEFSAKYQYGPWLRIRYKRLSTKPGGFSMPWAAYLRKYGDRYYFVGDLASDSIFTTVAEAWPYWEPPSKRLAKGVEELDAITITPPESEGAGRQAALKVYYRMMGFPPKTYLFGDEPALASERLEMWRALRRVVDAYRAGNTTAILALWDKERREFLEKNAGTAREIEALQEYYKNAKHIRVQSVLDGGELCWVYIIPEPESAPGELKILSYARENGGLLLTDPTRFSRPPDDSRALFAEKIVTSAEFLQSLSQLRVR